MANAGGLYGDPTGQRSSGDSTTPGLNDANPSTVEPTRTGASPLEDLPWRDQPPTLPGPFPDPITPPAHSTKSLKKSEGRLLTINAQGARWPVVYGRTKVGANIVYAALIGSYNWFVYDVCIGPISAMTGVDLGTRSIGAVTGGGYWIYLGDQNNTLNATLNANDANWVSLRPQRAYVIVKLPAPTSVNSGLDPLQFTGYVDGRLCRDPRLGTITVLTGNTSIGVATITNLASAPTVGVEVKGPGIPPWTFVNSVSGGGPYTANLSNNATTANTGASYTFDMPRVYTENPVLHIADFMTAWFGMRYKDTEIDWTTVGAAATICDQYVGSTISTTGNIGINSQTITNVITLPSTGQQVSGTGIPANSYVTAISGGGPYTITMSRPASATTTGVSLTFGYVRYRMGLSIRDAGNGKAILDAMRAHCMAYIVNNSGLYQIFIDTSQSNCGITFTDGSDGNPCNIRDTAAKGVIVRSKARSQIYTRILVDFTDALKDYAQNQATAEDPGIATGVTPDLPQTYQLVGTPFYEMARRLAIQILNKSGKDKSIEIPVRGPFWQEPLPMNRCTLWAPGFSGVDILLSDVRGIGSGGLGGTVLAEIYDAADYSNVIESQGTPNPTQAPGPSDEQAVVGISAKWLFPSAVVPLGDLGSPPNNGDVPTYDSGLGVFRPQPGGGGGGGTQVTGEAVTISSLSGTLAHTPLTNTLALYVGGVRLTPGVGNDYTLSGATITLAVYNGEPVLADYRY